MALRNRVYGAGKALVLAGSLLATYIIFAVGSVQYALRSREVQVPDLTNRSTADASQIVSELGLTLKVDDVKRLDLRIPAGRVLTQEPAPGSTSRQDRAVRGWVSAAPYPGIAGGIVLRQNPQQGFQIRPGEPISLEVSR